MTLLEKLAKEIAQLERAIDWHKRNAQGPFRDIPNAAHTQALRDLDLRRKIRAGL